MPATGTKVKGIKYGTLAAYNALSSHDADMLYFITDKGLLYRGDSIVVPVNVTTYTKTGSGNAEKVHFKVETYGSDPANPTVLEFDAYTKAAVDAITATITASINSHVQSLATSRRIGHVMLSDAINDTTHDADYALTEGAIEAFAATPAAVAAALAAATNYTDQQISAIAGAMLFKGTLGDAEAYSASAAYAVGDYCTHTSGTTTKLYRCTTAIAEGGETWDASHWTEVDRTVSALPAAHTVGWTYRVVAPGTYAGKPCEVGDLVICTATGTTANNDHWTVAQNNIDGAVTAAAVLEADRLVLGNGEKTVKPMAAGTNGNFLKQGASGPEWAAVAPATIGNTSGTATWRSVKFMTDIAGSMAFSHGSIVSLRFVDDAPANAQIQIGLAGVLNIYHRNAQIGAGVIKAGDRATLMLDTSGSPSVWHLIAIDRQAPASLQGFNNDIVCHGTCSTAGATSLKVADIDASSAQGMLVAIQFANDVPANATLKLNNSETTAHAIMHRGAAIAANAIRGGDTATLIYDASTGTGYWHLVAVDRPFDSAPTANSHNLVDSDAVYQAIENATLYWDPM